MNTAKMNKQPYYIGLDIGTASVGWAVTDASYNVIKKHGKALWGVRRFEPAHTAADRRLHRTARRRTQRRKQRLALLQELFAKEICKVDPGFFMRLHESRLWQEDKSIDQPNTLFYDEEFDDKAYHKAYPTIYHLRHALMTEDKPFDIRLVYLAIHHIIKHRGHFLLSGTVLLKDNSKFDKLYEEVINSVRKYLGEDLSCECTDDIQQILINKDLIQSEKAKKLLEIWKLKKNPQIKGVANLICGLSSRVKTLFKNEELDMKLKELSIDDSISFGTEEEEEKVFELQDCLEDKFELIERIKDLYNWCRLTNILRGKNSISAAKIDIYEKHQKDLKILKRLTREYPSIYRSLFKESGSGMNSYSSYIGMCKVKGEKVPIKKTSWENFANTIKKLIANLPESNDKSYVLYQIDKLKDFLPKSHASENGNIPYQLHEQELKAILGKVEKYFSFLKEKDEYGSVSDKTMQLFTFRIPFYVGPLNTTHRNHSWAVHTDKEGRILPWNFNERINEEKSAEKFITRMTNKCTYLLGKDVLPKNSLLYTEYMLFNELNNVKIGKAGTYLTEEQKEKLWKELFLTTKKVTLSKFSKFLIKEGIDKEEAVEIKGLDGGFKSSLASWIDLKNILGEDFTRDKAEEIIKAITLFSMDKKILKKYLMRIVSEPVAKQLSKLRYTGWGRFSKEFLTEITPRVTDDVQVLVDTSTGEIMNIITALKKSSLNLMEILSSTYGYSAAISEANKELVGNTVLSYETVKELTVSPAVKRPIWQTLKIIKEITHIMGAEPARIFIEMARDKQPDKGRTDFRKKQLIELYKKCKEDVRSWSNRESKDWVEEIESKSDSQLRSNKLFLYYTQMGKCMYTGKPIDLGALLKGQLYDRDHIYPQSQTKDDSLDNLVIVDNRENRDKSNTYPLSKNIRERQIGFWKLLRDKGFISKEKYFRLTRNTPFSDEEKSGFIARQLVETRQSIKLVGDILRQAFPSTTKVVAVKATLNSKFRQYASSIKIDDCTKECKYPQFIKVRELNNLHHAKDAYLTIVTGNVHYTKFTSDYLNFVKEKTEYSLNEKAIYGHKVKRKGVLAWNPDEKGIGKNGKEYLCMMSNVAKQMEKNNILVTRMSYVGQGELFDQLPCKKGIGQVSLKKDGPISDISKYGGYNKAKISYFMYVEGEDKKGKPVYVIEPMPLYMATRIKTLEEKQKYCEKIWLDNGGKNIHPKVIIGEIPKQALFNFNGFRMRIEQKSDDSYIYSPAEALILNSDMLDILKNTLKLVSGKTGKNAINEKALIHLYDIFLDKMENSIFNKMFLSEWERLIKARDLFLKLSIEDKCNAIAQILKIFSCNTKWGNLELLKCKSDRGRIKKTKNLSDKDSWYIIHQSVTGFYEQCIPLAPYKKS
ncbi:MAG: type II CRISPR RNA-guided endonuclease Cas9 [Dialister pneumosintes]